MMNKTRYGSLIFLFLFASQPVWSQEILSGIEINQSIRERHQQDRRFKSLTADMLELPFFDDFSRSSVYPDPAKWSDRYAFINNDYPVNPVSLNVATLDAIDHTGALYDHASVWPFEADSLTSLQINLDYPASDSIYLSFFYQPQGKGDVPQGHDSLRLEFYSPETENWDIVWSVPGDSLHDFRLVMIAVNDPVYLQEGFRFRFSNFASISDNRFNPGSMGNADHWHIDYVYLDRNRTFSDTVFRDVAMVEPLRSLLNNYESMPWNQFIAGQLAEMGSVLPVTYRNNDNMTRSVRRQLDIFSVREDRTVHDYSGGFASIGAGETLQYNSDLAYTFASPADDSSLFIIRAWLETDNFDFKGNDTVFYKQVFHNYFALDDGTSENGYGLFGGGTENASLAYRFRAYKPDSLRAIQIYFNQSLNHSSNKYFNLAVWNDNNGRPGNLIYSQEGARPVYEDQLNKFHTYHLESPVFVSQVFYVGLIQTTPDFLNIGFDVNRNNRGRIFYNINGEWVNTSFEGSLMIRPVTGNPLLASSPANPVKRSFKAWPNPAANVLYLEMEAGIEPGSVTYTLYNRTGQVVFQVNGNATSIDISSLPPGIYFLRAEGRETEFETRKILISK
jgi:hypothetical protein